VASIAESLAGSTPALWVEVTPPRGANPAPLLEKLRALHSHADAINLTDNSLGNVKMSNLAFGSLIKSRLEIAAVINVSCRDRNRLALRADLLGASALGIDAVVALTGDKIPPEADGSVVVSHDVNAFGLLAIIAALNRGDTGDGKPLLKSPPRIYAGAVANPNRQDLEREFNLLERKAAAGAKFVLTQPVFDANRAIRFVARASALGMHTVLGILPVKREAMAAYMKAKVKDLAGASDHLDSFAGMSEAAVRNRSIADNMALMKSLASQVAGFNIMSGGGPSLAIELALEFDKWRKQIA
jgi:5,10-methylenetetrahydrofolate reductase